MLATALLIATFCAQDSAFDKLVKQGDEAYAKRDQEGMPAKAIEAYTKAIVLDENRADPNWKLTLVYFWLGTHEAEGPKQQDLFRKGIDFAKIAISLDAECLPAHFWLGVMYGLFGQSKGIFQSLHMLEPMKTELEWVLKKDEKFEDAGAHRVLGRLYFKLPGIKGGDNEKAKKHLLRAIELAPKELLNYFYLAEVYAAESKKDEAKASLKKMLEQPDDPRWLPECKEQRADAKKLLEQLGKE